MHVVVDVDGVCYSYQHECMRKSLQAHARTQLSEVAIASTLTQTGTRISNHRHKHSAQRSNTAIEFVIMLCDARRPMWAQVWGNTKTLVQQ